MKVTPRCCECCGRETGFSRHPGEDSSVSAGLLFSFCASVFPRFFISLEVLCCCFCAGSSSHLLKSLPVTFRWGVVLVLLLTGFLCHCIGSAVQLFLLFLLAAFLSFYAFSGSNSSSGRLLENALWFYRRWWYSARLRLLPGQQTMVYFLNTLLVHDFCIFICAWD